jgi:hypothetical protein
MDMNKWMATQEMADNFSGYSADAFEMRLFGVFAQEKLLDALILEADTHGFIINGQTVNGLVPIRFLKMMRSKLEKSN